MAPGRENWVGCASLNNAPSPFIHSNPGICAYVTLHHTKGFADRIKVRILRWEKLPWNPQVDTV